jgi:hypothetical protein
MNNTETTGFTPSPNARAMPSRHELKDLPHRETQIRPSDFRPWKIFDAPATISTRWAWYRNFYQSRAGQKKFTARHQPKKWDDRFTTFIARPMSCPVLILIRPDAP